MSLSVSTEKNVVILRPRVEGKFLVVKNEKFYVRGVTYGTFRPDENGDEYSLAKVEQDFQQIAASGFNAVRIYTVPPLWLLDIAQRNDLYVMVGLPWEQHVTFLDDKSRIESIKERVRFGVQSCAGHPAVLCYTIGNEIPSRIVRWYGPRKVERFLKELYQIAKTIDPEGLVTYVNYPSTEYLELSFVDFLSFNVYLETEERLNSYLARLQNIAGELPLVLAEIGLDSRRNGEEKQAEMLDWQIRITFRAGCAGAFIFSWTDEWYRGGFDIEDWDFGLTTRLRAPKAALSAVAKAFAESPFPQNVSLPYISVVVCTYNGSRFIRDCMEGLMKLEYPNFEVIVVDDGSKDNTAHIVSEYPFKLIRTENQGLGSARNTGLEAARGEIIAYTDDDARPDPHWLHYLAMTYLTTNHAAVGGPNIAPPGDGWIAECVANAPGGPVHVLLDDEIAEHIPGCNSSFRAENLRQIGGWDPRYRAAGDDVDVCWRLQHMGWTIGYNPAAVVWHHRRNSINDYWNQQIGYGKAESLLEEKYPEKYNATGHLSWDGRLYGRGLTQALISLNDRIYQGRWGVAPFQSVYQSVPNRWWSLPLMPEWYLIIGLLAIVSGLGILWTPLLGISLLLLALSIGAVIAQAIISASKASFYNSSSKTDFELLKLYTVTAFLHILQPLARLKGRIRYGLTPWRRRGNPRMVVPRQHTESVWSESLREPEQVLKSLKKLLEEDGAVVRCGGDFDRWDLEVRGGIMARGRLLMTLEEHGGGKQLFRFKIWSYVSRKWLFILLFLASLSMKAGFDYPFEGKGVLIVFIFLSIMTLSLLALIYNECASPVAAILGSIESLKRNIATEVYPINDAISKEENKEIISPEYLENDEKQSNSQVVLNKSRSASAANTDQT